MNTSSFRILIVDDEPQIRRFLRASLSAHSYTILEAPNAADGLRLAATEHPDLVILDLGLPDMDGINLLQRLREWSQVPVIILSVRGQESEKVRALDAGADDYLTKPFGMSELMARIRVALRHQVQKAAPDPLFRTGELEIDLAARIVRLRGTELKLTPKEYELLRQLVIHAGKVVTQRHLLREVWGPTYMTETQYLRVYMGTLRNKLEDSATHPRYLITEPGVGYRLRIEDEDY